MRIFLMSILFFAVLASALLVNADFPGWQELRVIHQEGRPMRMQAGDIDADGRDEMELLLEEGESNEMTFLTELKNLLPSEDEIGEMVGVMVIRLEVDDEGIFAEYAMELPAP